MYLQPKHCLVYLSIRPAKQHGPVVRNLSKASWRKELCSRHNSTPCSDRLFLNCPVQFQNQQHCPLFHLTCLRLAVGRTLKLYYCKHRVHTSFPHYQHRCWSSSNTRQCWFGPENQLSTKAMLLDFC